MQNKDYRDLDISFELIEAIRTFPMSQEVTHCGKVFQAPPFDIYVVCPVCEVEIKARKFSSYVEIEDVFDAVFEWMMQPNALAIVKESQELMKKIRGQYTDDLYE